MKSSALAKLSLSAVLFFSACSDGKLGDFISKPTDFSKRRLGRELNITALEERPTLSPEFSTSPSVQVKFTVEKEVLLNQEFLYGADIQYSTIHDPNLGLFLQSLAIGHIPAHFRIVGDELQLIAEHKIRSPSDVNHPEQLLSRYKILFQTETTLTISGGNSSILLAEWVTGLKSQGDPSNTVGLRPFVHAQDFWIRSFEYVPLGNYVLQQTSVVFEDGNTVEFMESLMPRSTLAPGNEFTKIRMNPHHIKGGTTGLFSRFRFLPGETIYEGETPVSYAQHFDLSSPSQSRTIQFYVTRNIPESFLKPVQAAVEGWNRYFEKQKGKEWKIIQFMGRLPEGIAIGDPRFNVINWDNRSIAGAAYESQASEPTTGVQSHTLIYMPVAWVKIGLDYWKNGQFSDPPHPQLNLEKLMTHKNLTELMKLSCLRDLREELSLQNSGRLSKAESRDFAIQMLKQTLFHEVGHSLGLAHNFKGSLSYDRSQAEAIFSTSIMDYNDFEIERGIFLGLDNYEGPELEYDRQILSVLYNEGADIRESDPIVPACNDAEADQEIGGVDPLCVRYDIEHDPTKSIETAYRRIFEENLTGDIVLKEALLRAGSDALDSDTLNRIKTFEDLAYFLVQIKASLHGTIEFYLTKGKASFSKTIITNLKSLLVFQENILPSDIQENEMRKRALWGATVGASLNHLPDFLNDSVNLVISSLKVALERSPLVHHLDRARVSEVMELVELTLQRLVEEFETNERQGLPQLRAAVLKSLKRKETVPYFFQQTQLSDNDVDVESRLIHLLNDAVADTHRTYNERIFAATSLMSFSGRLSWGDQMIENTRVHLVIERDRARNNQDREVAQTILTILKTSPYRELGIF